MAYNPYEAASAGPMSAQQKLAQKGLGPLAGGQPGRRRSTGGGGDDSAPTPPPPPTDWTQWEPKTYPTALPSLSAGQLGALAERRRLVDERAKAAQAAAARGESIAETSALASRQAAERASKRSLDSFMREAAGKGLARQPMVAGRQVRVANEDLRLKYGEISGQLSSDLMALQDMVDEAMRQRDTELARIEQDRVNMQADLGRLFPAGSMYRV